jgi:hypothetical protein
MNAVAAAIVCKGTIIATDATAMAVAGMIIMMVIAATVITTAAVIDPVVVAGITIIAGIVVVRSAVYSDSDKPGPGAARYQKRGQRQRH